jgi:hypothetical protein
MYDAEPCRRAARSRRRRHEFWHVRAFLVLASVIGGISIPARAAELAARGPAGCPDAAELTFRVERAIGMPIAHAAPLRFSVFFEAAPAGSHTARLAVERREPQARSERVLGARACTELADAVAVAIALALGAEEPLGSFAAKPAPLSAEPVARVDRVASARPTPGMADAADATSSAEAMSSADATAAADAPPAADPPAGDSTRSTLSPALAVTLVGDAGSLPGAGLGLGIAAELRGARIALRAGGTLFFDRHVALPDASGPEPGADMRLALGSLSACTIPFGTSGSTAAASLCAGWELGRLEAVGTGVREPRRAGALWSAPRLDVGLSVRAGTTPVRLFTQLTAAAPLNRDDFYLRDWGTVHRPPVVTGRLALGFDVTFK